MVNFIQNFYQKINNQIKRVINEFIFLIKHKQRYKLDTDLFLHILIIMLVRNKLEVEKLHFQKIRNFNYTMLGYDLNNLLYLL